MLNICVSIFIVASRRALHFDRKLFEEMMYTKKVFIVIIIILVSIFAC